MSELTDQDREFIQIMLRNDGNGRSEEAQVFFDKKGILTPAYSPSVAALSKLVSLSIEKLKPNTLAYALNFTWTTSQGGKSRLQLYDKSYIDYAHGRRLFARGESAWQKLVANGASPETPGFMECALVLANCGASINQHMSIAEFGKGSGSLLDQLCMRGWLDAIEKIEKAAQEQFSLEGAFDSDGALESALVCGHGPVAKLLIRRGDDLPQRALWWAADGFASPRRALHGASATPTMEDRALGLRIVAGKMNAARVDAQAWDKLSDPLRSQQHLTLWLMAAGAKATAGPWTERVLPWASKLAFKEKFDWKIMEAVRAEMGEHFDQPLKKGLFGLAGPSAAKVKASELWLQARESARERSINCAPIAQAVECLDQNRFAEAEKILADNSAEQKNQAAVAMLGLAKLGYWGMASKNGIGDDSRHPLRWAGFKMAISCAGPDVLDRPVDGLGGITLMGMCAALGYADACAALVHAGARVDPDPLTEAVSPLALAIRFGHDPIAWSLLNAGASPLEGAVQSSFGFVRKAWAIHEALDANNYPLAKAMIEANPLCAALPNLEGQTFAERAKARAENPEPDAHGVSQEDRLKMAALGALAERASSFRRSIEESPPAPRASRPGP